MGQIDKLLAGIDAYLRNERERRDEPVMLSIVPPAQRVREFLAEVANPIWLNAAVISYTVPSGTIHQAALLIPESKINHLVFEAIDGSLSLMMADNASDGVILSGITADEYRRERQFMSRVSRCMPEISCLVSKADGVHHQHKIALMNLLLEIERRLRASLEDKLR